MLKLFKQSDIERLKSLMSDSWAAKIYDILGTRTMIAKIQELVRITLKSYFPCETLLTPSPLLNLIPPMPM